MKKLCTILRYSAALLSPPAAVFATPPEEQPTAGATAVSDLPLTLTEKMQGRASLTLVDLQVLAQHRVPDDTTIAYLRSTTESIQLTTAALDQLRAAGVTDRVINYLLLANPLEIVPESRVDARRYGAPRSGSAYQPYRQRGFTALRFRGSPGPRGGHQGGGHRGGAHRGGHHHGGHR